MDRIEREGLEYQPYYCEENVWRLLARPELSGTVNWAVIVSNSAREVVCLRQRSGRPVDGLVHWDYHVFAVVTDSLQGRLAIDMDSDLPFPSPLSRYLAATFPPGEIQRALTPRFRVMKGGDYVSLFVSDRSHMRRPDGSWIAPPPPWPAPGAGSGRPSLLADWTDINRRKPGDWYDSQQMASFAADSGKGY